MQSNKTQHKYRKKLDKPINTQQQRANGAIKSKKDGIKLNHKKDVIKVNCKEDIVIVNYKKDVVKLNIKDQQSTKTFVTISIKQYQLLQCINYQ